MINYLRHEFQKKPLLADILIHQKSFVSGIFYTHSSSAAMVQFLALCTNTIYYLSIGVEIEGKNIHQGAIPNVGTYYQISMWVEKTSSLDLFRLIKVSTYFFRTRRETKKITLITSYFFSLFIILTKTNVIFVIHNLSDANCGCASNGFVKGIQQI